MKEYKVLEVKKKKAENLPYDYVFQRKISRLLRMIIEQGRWQLICRRPCSYQSQLVEN